MNHENINFLDQIKLYVWGIGLSVYLGSTALVETYCVFDDHISIYPVSNGIYVLRTIVAGFGYASFFTCGDILSTFLRTGRWKEQNWVGKGKLWVASCIVGTFWCPECDFAYYMAHGEFVLDTQPEFTAGEIASSFVVFLGLHQMIFKVAVRSMHAKWADHFIDFQVALAAFMFYLSSAFVERNSFVDSILVGSFTAFFAAISGAVFVLFRWIYRERPEENYTEVL